jgi:ectoine hydroxylase-related dioxygenase (phytanoyl-CoA dioxygenase family)
MNTASPSALLRRFEQDGVVYPIPVISPQKSSAYLASFSQLEELLERPIKRMGNPALHFSWAYRLATEPAVLDAVEEILGADLLIAGTLIFCKYPRDPAYVAWHQDTFYSNLHLTPSLSAWIALLDSTPENGCMRVVPGSHSQGTLPHQETGSVDNLLKRGEEIQVDVDEAQATDVVLKAGEMSLHHNSIIHGSRSNRSDTKRIGFIVRFVTPEYNLGPQRTPFLPAKGTFARCGHLKIAEGPADGDIRAALETWERSNSN